MADSRRLPSVFVRLIPKRGDNDCAIASLASFTGSDYEEVLLAAGKVSKTLWNSGLSGPEHIRVCKRLGVKARWFKTYDIEEDTGVLWVEYHENAKKAHSVVLVEGRIYDPDYNPVFIAEHDDYFRHFNAHPRDLLKRIGE